MSESMTCNPDICPDEPSALAEAVEKRDLAEVKRIVDAAKLVSTDNDEVKVNDILNHARRWSCISYRIDGSEEREDWFDLTALAAAALTGQHAIVQLLLEEGADPTIIGRHQISGVSMDAFDAVRIGMRNEIEDDKALRRCDDLLRAAKPFWVNASHSTPQYDSLKRMKLTNSPSNLEGLLSALRTVPFIPESLSTVNWKPTVNDAPLVADGMAQAEQRRDATYERVSSKRAASQGRREAKIAKLELEQQRDGQQQATCSNCRKSLNLTHFSRNQKSKGHEMRCYGCCGRRMKGSETSNPSHAKIARLEQSREEGAPPLKRGRYPKANIAHRSHEGTATDLDHQKQTVRPKQGRLPKGWQGHGDPTKNKRERQGECIRCKKRLPLSSFSRSQRAKLYKRGHMSCQDCVMDDLGPLKTLGFHD